MPEPINEGRWPQCPVCPLLRASGHGSDRNPKQEMTGHRDQASRSNDRDPIMADRSQALLRSPVHSGRFAAVLLSVLGFAVTAPAASGYDPVQRCLDLVQLNLVGKIAPALPVTSHQVRNPPKHLPIQCLNGTLKEIKSAL